MTHCKLAQSTCAYCGVGCGVDIEISASQQPVKIQGSPEHSANYGRLCVKGTNLLETVSLTDRLLFPEVAGQRVAWSHANAEIAKRFKDIISRHGADSVAFYVSGQLLTEDYYVANKLMKGYIGSANIDTNSRLCMSSAVSAYKRAFGEDVVPVCYEDLEQSNLILLVGSNAAWTHPVLFQRIERARAKNPALKVVVLDPRRTTTAEQADVHLALQPGADAAFFCGLLRYLYEQQALDERYIYRHTRNFEQAINAAHVWSVEKVAQFCQLEQEDVLRVYQWFCQSATAVTVYSMGINQSTSGVDKCQAIINCHLASGKIGRNGCGPFSITGQPNAMGGREVGGLANQLAAHCDIENVEHRQQVQSFWQSPTIADKPGFKAIDMFDAMLSGNIKAVWIMATNPMVSLPDKSKVERALAACDFVVVSECVTSNDTLRFADVKLPATPWLEKNGTVTNSERCISRQRGVLSPAGEALPDWQIVCNVAREMGFTGFDYQGVHEVFCEHAALSGVNNYGDRQFDISGLAQLDASTYEQLTPIQWPVTKRHPEGRKRLFQDGKFSKPSGCADFIAINPKLPDIVYRRDLPFLLNSGRLRDQWHTMTRTGKTSKLTTHSPFSTVTLNPINAQKMNIAQGDLVRLSNDLGQVIALADVCDVQRENELFMPIHWSNTNASSAAVNSVYSSVADPLSGQPQTKQTAVALTKVIFAQYGQLHLREHLAVKFDYWQQVKTTYGWMVDFALTRGIEDPVLWCQQLTKTNGEWGHRQIGKQHYLCCWLDDELSAFVVLDTRRQEVNWSWLTHVFEQKKLALPLLAALLSGEVESEFRQGSMVCSCFGVGENSIEAAISSGEDSVEKLGNALKCGTNCGSCKPELNRLIKANSVNLADTQGAAQYNHTKY